MSSEHSLRVAGQSIQQFSPSMPSSPPTRGATPNSNIPGPLPPLSTNATSFHNSSQPANGSNLHYPHPLMSLSTALNGPAQQQENTTPTSALDLNADIDPQILEALKSKDRIFVLKCGEAMETLIREPSKSRVEITPATTYQRMLVYRCSTFYKTTVEVDPTKVDPATKVLFITLMPESCIPERKISDLVPAEPAPQPAIKIMQRTTHDRKPKSQANSVAGDDAELSDVEPSESGSLGGKSSSTGGHSKKRPTIEEREAAYKEARSRIFMGFEEKEKGNMNSSSSSLSLTSSSAGAGSSGGDLDDASSPATESEWLSSVARDNRKEYRRESGASSSRNGRPSFNGPASVRNSRASSPSFKYASIYDSPQLPAYYDPHAPYPEPLNLSYHPSQYPAPYPPPPGHLPNIPFSQPYPYYPTYNPYQPLVQPQQHPVDGMPPTNGDMYSGPMAPGNNFPWQNGPPPPPPPPPPHVQHPQPPPQSQPNPNQMMNAHPPSGQGPAYMPYSLQPYPYPAPGYYPPPPGQMAPPYPNQSPVAMYDTSRPPNGTVGSSYGPANPGRPAINNGTNIPNNNGRNARCTSGPNINGIPKGRSGPGGPPSRSGWSFGPGVGMGGYVAPQTSGGDVVGPRLSSSRRSGNASRSSSINDDVSSASSTSSSSRRTYTSTTSSQHPLPPRPDWAVAMTMATSNHSHGRNHHHDLSARSMPVTRNGNNAGPPANMPLPGPGPGPTPALHPTDFPPLSSAAINERRPPGAMGAWGNSNVRSAFIPNQGQYLPPAKPYLNLANNAQMHHFDDSDRCFERPPPKSAELFNHKSGKRLSASNPGGNGRAQMDKEKERKNDALVEQVAAMSLDQGPPSMVAHSSSQEAGLTVSVT